MRRDGFASLQTNATSTLTTRAAHSGTVVCGMFLSTSGTRTVDEPRLPGSSLAECVGMTGADSTEIQWTTRIRARQT